MLSEQEFRRLQACQRLLKKMKSKKTIYLSEAYRLCGHGLSVEQFDQVVWGLCATSGWLRRTEGERGATILHLIPHNESFEVAPATTK